jgi:hypothetical protein
MAQAAVRVKEQGTGKSPGHPSLEKGERGGFGWKESGEQLKQRSKYESEYAG